MPEGEAGQAPGTDMPPPPRRPVRLAAQAAHMRMTQQSTGSSARSSAREEWQHIRPDVRAVSRHHGAGVMLMASWDHRSSTARSAATVAAGSVLVLHDRLLAVQEVAVPHSTSPVTLAEHAILPVTTCVLWRAADLRALAHEEVPHAEAVADSMRECEVFQTRTRGHQVRASEVVQVGTLVYDEDFLLGKMLRRGDDNAGVWRDIAAARVFWCTAAAKLHKLPCEHRDGRGGGVPAAPRWELCLGPVSHVPRDRNGRVQIHRCDSRSWNFPAVIMPADDDDEDANNTPGALAPVTAPAPDCAPAAVPAAAPADADSDREAGRASTPAPSTLSAAAAPAASPAATSAQRRGTPAVSEMSSRGAVCDTYNAGLAWPDYKSESTATAKWLVCDQLSGRTPPAQLAQDLLGAQRLYHLICAWLDRKARRVDVYSPNATDLPTSTTMHGLARRHMIQWAHNAGAIDSVQFDVTQACRADLMPASVEGGRSVRVQAAIAPAVAHTTVFAMHIKVADLDTVPVSNLKLPSHGKPFQHMSTNTFWAFSCADPAAPCPGAPAGCRCYVTVQEKRVAGEVVVEVSGTLLRLGGARGDRLPIPMDVAAPHTAQPVLLATGSVIGLELGAASQQGQCAAPAGVMVEALAHQVPAVAVAAGPPTPLAWPSPAWIPEAGGAAWPAAPVAAPLPGQRPRTEMQLAREHARLIQAEGKKRQLEAKRSIEAAIKAQCLHVVDCARRRQHASLGVASVVPSSEAVTVLGQLTGAAAAGSGQLAAGPLGVGWPAASPGVSGTGQPPPPAGSGQLAAGGHTSVPVTWPQSGDPRVLGIEWQPHTAGDRAQ